jgi:hypothetical protein
VIQHFQAKIPYDWAAPDMEANRSLARLDVGLMTGNGDASSGTPKRAAPIVSSSHQMRDSFALEA